MNQNKSDLTKIQTLIHGQESNVILVDKQEYKELKHDMKEMQVDIAAMKGAQSIPITPAATPSCSKLFPHVDPTNIAPPEPPSAPRSSYFPANMQPPIDPMTTCTPIDHTTPVREQLLPYGQRLIVNNSGCAIECWIRKCYRRIGQPNKYEAVTCGGDNIKFQHKDVIIDDFEPSHTAHIPHDYIVTIMGGYDATPEATTHTMKIEYPEDNDFSAASHHSYHRHHNQQQNF